MPVDDYADLPDWIRPGAKLALLFNGGSHSLVTVTRITRTQIVTVSDSNRNAEFRFEREPVPANLPYRPEPSYVRRGDRFDTLVRRDHPRVVTGRIDAIARNAAYAAEQALTVYSNPKRNNDDRPLDERAMDLIDAIENAARTARRKIEQLTDPGGFLAAGHAQSLEDHTT